MVGVVQVVTPPPATVRLGLLRLAPQPVVASGGSMVGAGCVTYPQLVHSFDHWWDRSTLFLGGDTSTS